MRAQRVMFLGPGRVAVEEAEVPAPGRGQVVLEALATVISPGTELAYLHQLENARWPLPGPSNGYCFCGTVAARGPDVAELTEGQRVVTALAHASAGVAEAAHCYTAPDGLADEQAATFMLGAISLQAVRKARVRLGQSVAVVGLGVIGNYAGQLARAAGATLVLGIDPVGWRRELALQAGFDAAVESSANFPFDRFPRLNKAQGFDVVIEATGAPAPIVDALRLARRLGRVALLGSTRGLTDKVDFYNDVHRKGLTVVGAHNGVRPTADDVDTLFTIGTDIHTVLDLLGAERVTAAPLVSDTIPGVEAARAYERLATRNEPLLTVALRWA